LFSNEDRVAAEKAMFARAASDGVWSKFVRVLPGLCPPGLLPSESRFPDVPSMGFRFFIPVFTTDSPHGKKSIIAVTSWH
jgi:hypothetical protein